MKEETAPFISPEGRDRLNHSKNLYISLEAEHTDFDFATGIIYIFGLGGNFLASQIDLVTGEYVYDQEAAESIRNHRVLVIHPQNVENGNLILIQLCDRGPNGSQRQANLLFRYNDHESDWEPISGFDTRVIDMRPADRAQRLRDYFQGLQ